MSSYTVKRALKSLYGYLRLAGIDPLRAASSLRGLPPYLANLKALRRAATARNEDWPITALKPCLTDRYETSGAGRGHYFHQDLLVAQRVFERRPELHVDVGSRIDGFVAHVASFREIQVLDVRPLQSDIRNVVFREFDLMAPLPVELQGLCDSLSCLHVLEHLGLGRYGDPICPRGHIVGLANLHGILRAGGTLYLSVPTGRQRIEFDAHRVFSLPTLLALTGHGFEVLSLACVDDAGDLHTDMALDDAAVSRSFGYHYGCAILELRKLPTLESPWPT